MNQLLAELFDTYYKDVYTYLYSLCRDASLSEDLTSEVFLEVVKSVSGFRRESDVKTWLFTIARRRWFAWLKDKKRQVPTTPIHELFESAQPGTEDPSTDLARFISVLLAREPELTQKVFQMRLDGYSYFEIGRVCGISESSARVLFFRTKTNLRKSLEKEGFSFD